MIASRTVVSGIALAALALVVAGSGCGSSGGSAIADGGSGGAGGQVSGGSGGRGTGGQQTSGTGGSDDGGRDGGFNFPDGFNIDGFSFDGFRFDAAGFDAALTACAATVSNGAACTSGTDTPCAPPSGNVCICRMAGTWFCF
ncbi:MAG TPA: hypothetical protein VFH68_16395 [Polyangia bacterium]|jgi:hypothetical protein|nr:hypothetical protein [Polyangia bacterium]